jgi:L-lactate dehydrogenase complex protein LldG
VDTSDARQKILARIRRAHGRSAAPTPEELAAADDYVARHGRAPGPTVGEDVLAHFETQAQRMSSTTERVERLADVPAAVARFLGTHGLPTQAVCWETLSGLDWAGAGLSVEARAPRNEDMVGITGVFAAIAETGTLMLLSGPQTPASTHLLPETHIGVVSASRVVRHYEDGFARMREERGAPPRAMNLVSGPSRTGDIEQTIVLGAHGPYRVHVVVVEGE